MNSKAYYNDTNPPSEQLTLSNPFIKNQSAKKKTNQIIIKYAIYVSIMILLLASIIIIIVKTSQIKALSGEYKENEGKVLRFKTMIHQINKDIQSEQQEKTKRDVKYKELSGVHTELSKKKSQLLKKGKDNTQHEEVMQLLKNQIQLETITNNRLIQENGDIEMRKSELENKVNEYKRDLNALREQSNSLQMKLNEEQDRSHKMRVINLSNIITSQYYDTLRQWFNKKRFKMTQLYKKNLNTFTPENFHYNTNDYNNTIVIVSSSSYQGNRNEKIVIGGYTTQKWSDNGMKGDSDAFLFDLVKEKQFPILDRENAISCSVSSFPSFGNGDLTILTDSIQSNFPKAYGRENGVRLELTNGSESLPLDHFEVYTFD